MIDKYCPAKQCPIMFHLSSQVKLRTIVSTFSSGSQCYRACICGWGAIKLNKENIQLNNKHHPIEQQTSSNWTTNNIELNKEQHQLNQKQHPGFLPFDWPNDSTKLASNKIKSNSIPFNLHNTVKFLLLASYCYRALSTPE